jgi:cytochrome c-type biogenesis protein CcmE
MSAAPAPSPTPVSRGAAWKIVLSVVVVTGVVGYVLRTSVVSAEYYKHVDEVMASPAQFHNKRLQVHGNVVPGSIEQAKGTLMYRFKIETGAMSRPDPRPPAVISATYTGLVPDTFKDGAEVVAKGTLGADEKLEVVPDGIMAKCPSKYDSNAKAKVDDPGVAAK